MCRFWNASYSFTLGAGLEAGIVSRARFSSYRFRTGSDAAETEQGRAKIERWRRAITCIYMLLHNPK